MFIIESASLFSDMEKSTPFNESDEIKPLPECIFPEIRAITANKVTRNNTFYPKQDIEKSIKSLTSPYRVPIIREHQTGGFLGEAVDPFGRVESGRYVELGKDQGYLSVVVKLTDKEAIEKVLTERYLTVSIGVIAEEVLCSICHCNIAEEGCDHEKGETYVGKDGLAKKCYWIIKDFTFREISFVLTPSDDEAKVIRKDVLGNIKESDNKETITESEKEKTPILSIWGIEESDEYYTSESTLSKDKRDKLPDSAFCGPGRSFPAHDYNHCVVGLRLLGRYKGPGNKEAIKNCLLKKRDSFKEFANEYKLLVIDKESSELTELISVSDNIINNITKKSETIFSDCNYQLVESIEDDSSLIVIATEDFISILKEKEFAMSQETSNTDLKMISIEEHEALISALNTEIAETSNINAALNKEVIEARGAYHQTLAEYNAFVQKHLNKPGVVGKSLGEVSEGLYKRSVESLTDSLSDLLLECNTDGTKTQIEEKIETSTSSSEVNESSNEDNSISKETVEKVENPVLTDTSTIVESVPNKENKSEADDPLLIAFGIRPESINKFK